MARDRARVTRRGRGPPLRPLPIRAIDLSHLPRWWLATAAAVPLVLILVLGTALAVSSGALAPALRVGDPAPDFALADLDGEPVRLADHAGEVVLVNFWASWCPECIDEFPLLDAALEAHAADGLVVIGIVYGDRSEAAREFADRLGAGWPVAMDPGGQVADRYGVFGPPESWVIGRDGLVTSRQIGPYDAETLEAALTEALGAGTAEDR